MMDSKNTDEPATVTDRRRLLGAIGSLGAAVVWGCGGSETGTTATSSTVSTGATDTTSTTTTTGSAGAAGSTGSAGACAIIPQETQGPYPLLAILSNAAMVRQDITEGKTGVPLTLRLKLVNVNGSCAPIANAAVYVWHCDKDGVYSGYSTSTNGNTLGQTFLRGIQVSDTNGEVTFTTIYPGWYAGRITHVHFQIYLADNLQVTATATSQIAFPLADTTAVYNSTLYVSRGQNTSVTSFAADNVFSDGTTYQMAALTGDAANGYTATLTVGIAA